MPHPKEVKAGAAQCIYCTLPSWGRVGEGASAELMPVSCVPPSQLSPNGGRSKQAGRRGVVIGVWSLGYGHWGCCVLVGVMVVVAARSLFLKFWSSKYPTTYRISLSKINWCTGNGHSSAAEPNGANTEKIVNKENTLLGMISLPCAVSNNMLTKPRQALMLTHR